MEARTLMSAVTGFTLVDAVTDRDIATLTEGATINFATLSSRRLNVRADTTDGVESVRFGLDAKPRFRTDSSATYALAGNRGGNYFGWTPRLGLHTLSATPYSRNRGSGVAGQRLTIRFTVVDSPVAAAPTALQAHPVSASAVTLSWTDNATNESGFLVDRAADGGAFERVATVGPNATSYSDQTLIAGGFTYRVCAYNAGGSSGYSNLAFVATNPVVPTPPPELNPTPTPVSDPPPQLVYSPPIVITRGGIYTGNWESLDVNVPAVTIQTADPVVIENANVRGRGVLIATAVEHAHITVQNTHGYGLNPDVFGLTPGRFFEGTYFDSVLLRDNYLEGTGGIKLLEYRGDSTPAETVRVVGNVALNIDGRKSDGAGGYLDFNKRTRLSDGFSESGYKIRQFLQLDKVQGVPGVEIAWNKVVNEPGRSRVEDNINIYKSGGTAQSPIQIHHNYVQGAYTVKPWQASYSDDGYEYDWGYSGGGILLGDGSSGVAFVDAHDNTVVSTTNYGIAIAAGHDMHFYRNRVFSSGLLPDGRWTSAQNVGLYIWDLYGTGPENFYNNTASDNVVGWVKETDGTRNDWWVPDATSFPNNTHWDGAITPRTEADEFALWQAGK